MPLRTKMMEMRCQPASFSRSRRMVIWKTTDTRQCTRLGGGAHAGVSLPTATSQALQERWGPGVQRGAAAGEPYPAWRNRDSQSL